MSESQPPETEPSSSGGGAGIGPGAVGSLLANRYRLEQLIGHGGMASVYKGHDESLGRTVALKIFRTDVADSEDIRRRHEEMTMLAGLNHYGLVTLFDAASSDRADDSAFLVMEYVEGEDLRTRLMSGPLDPKAVALIGADIADALEYVHERGVLHRDVKPGNILLPEPADQHTGPRAKLADFGIARIIDGTRLTMTGSVLGTASYLSPEQAGGGPLGPSSDVYSLGLVLLESLTGARAFPGTGLESAAARLSKDPEIPSSVGPAWRQLLRWMTRRDPEDRPRAAEAADRLRALAVASQEVLDHGGKVHLVGSNRTTVVLERPQEDESADAEAPPRRRAVVAAVMAAGALVILSAGALFGLTQLEEQPNRTNLPVVPVVQEQYPPVDGELGEHLRQLQRSVEP